MARADEIMRAAGWTPTKLVMTAGGVPQINTHGRFAIANLVCGHPPEGAGAAFVVKDISKIPQDMAAELGLDPADYPDEPHEAAEWLVARYAAPAPEPEPEPEAEPDPPLADETAPNVDVEWVGEAEPTDVDFDLVDALSVPELEGPDLGATAQEPDGPVAYFSDDIRTIQLAKLGRLGQIARELKAALQEGWTVEEFASLQNLIMRIDRGEAPDNPEARARFLAISERSRAMNAVDAFKGQREAELEAADRDGVMAFDPEAGWP